MVDEFSVETEIWQGERRSADKFDLIEGQPTVHLNRHGSYTAVLRIWRAGNVQGQHVECPFPSEEEAKSAALRMQSEFRPNVTAETPVWE